MKKDLQRGEDDSNPPTNSELGCLFSHLHAIKKGFEDDQDYIIVMEDDIDLKHMTKWKKTIEEIVQDANRKIKDWEVLQLHILGSKVNNQMINISEQFHYWGVNFFSAGMYLVNRKGMRNIVQKMRCSSFMSDRNIKLLADHYIYLQNKSYSVTKPIVNNKLWPVDVMSNIQDNNDSNYNFTKESQKVIDDYYRNL